MSMHLCKRGFMPGYNIWTEHGEQFVSEPLLEHEHDNQTADGLDEMLADFGDAMHSVEEEPTADWSGCQMEASGVGLIVIEDFYRPTMVLGTKGMHLEKG